MILQKSNWPHAHLNGVPPIMNDFRIEPFQWSVLCQVKKMGMWLNFHRILGDFNHQAVATTRQTQELHQTVRSMGSAADPEGGTVPLALLKLVIKKMVAPWSGLYFMFVGPPCDNPGSSTLDFDFFSTTYINDLRTEHI